MHLCFIAERCCLWQILWDDWLSPHFNPIPGCRSWEVKNAIVLTSFAGPSSGRDLDSTAQVQRASDLERSQADSARGSRASPGICRSGQSRRGSGGGSSLAAAASVSFLLGGGRSPVHTEHSGSGRWELLLGAQTGACCPARPTTL